MDHQAQCDNFKKVTQSIQTNLDSIQTNLDFLRECYREQYREMYGHEYEGLLLKSNRIELNNDGYDAGPQFDKTLNSEKGEFKVTKSSGFPDFDGSNPQEWLGRANQYFENYPKDEFAKVRHASFYMVGVADLWYIEYLEGKQPVTWDFFSNLLLERFLVIDQADIMADLPQLSQGNDAEVRQGCGSGISGVEFRQMIEENVTDLSTRKSRKRARYKSPEMILRIKLDQCSKNGDPDEAIRLYNEARAENVMIDVYHYNVLLYLCSVKSDDTELGEKVLATLEKGFEIFKQMSVDNVGPNEATFTNASRLAAAIKNPELAFDILKQMKDHDIVPKLRSYNPALFGFCGKGMADEAYEVDLHMGDNGVLAEEPELAALLRVSSENQREGKVYKMMHRLRGTVRQVSEETASIMEEWFKSTRAGEVGEEKWDSGKVNEGIVEGGGGWHALGWLGRGNWRVLRTRMDGNGICQACGENLVSIDIDPNETENFEKSLAKLACEKEARNNFEWLRKNGPFDAVGGGANLDFANQHVFSFAQIKGVVNQLRQISPSNKLPLVVIHQARVHGGSAQHPNNKKLLVVGASAYARLYEYARIHEVCDKQEAVLLVDIAHLSGLVVAGVIYSPFDYADVVTITTHKSLFGTQGAMIIFRKGVKENQFASSWILMRAGNFCVPSTKELKDAITQKNHELVYLYDTNLVGVIAWLLNLRGRDMPHSLVMYAYLVVEIDGATLFIDDTKITLEVMNCLENAGIELRPYESIPSEIENLAAKGGLLLVGHLIR